MYCYEVKVPATNPICDRFQIFDKYYPCSDGTVFVVARNIAAAGALIPIALSIKQIGVAYAPETAGAPGGIVKIP